jgi:hypothetical protein
VPAISWAYGALDELQKQGIAIGYPDGTFSGRRVLTRREFARAVVAAVEYVRHVGPPDAYSGDCLGVRRLLSPGQRRVRETELAARLAILSRLEQEFRETITFLEPSAQWARRYLAAVAERYPAPAEPTRSAP